MDTRGSREILPAGLTPRGLSRLQASAYAGISPALFDRAVKDNVMPAPVRIYGRVVWDREAIDRAFARLSDGGNGETDRWDRVAV